MLYTAAKNNIIILRLPSHATMVLQPNDQAVNKKFKQRLDIELQSLITSQVVVEPFMIPKLCEDVLKMSCMRTAIISSWASVGIFPLDGSRILEKIKKYRSKIPEERDKELFDKVLILVEEKFEIQKTEQEKKRKRKEEAGKSISFPQSETLILNSSSSLARRRISNEWTQCKTMNKQPLLHRMHTLFGFTHQETAKKTLPELRELFCDRLLKDEKLLVKTYEEEVKNVSIPIPPRITNLLYKPQSEENKNKQQEVERTSNSIRLHLRIPIQIEKKE
jgi:hypothetical protein